MRHGKKTFLITTLIIGVCMVIISCGEDKTTTPESLPPIPTLTTTEVSQITRSSAESGGDILSDSGFAVIEYGICWSTNSGPTINDNKTSVSGSLLGSFNGSLTGLTRNTTYYVRAYATNSKGTGYGNSISFITLDSSYTVTDIDGNVYQAISIGTQVWMTESLRVKHYRNGDEIPIVSNSSTWINLTTGAYCSYDNFFANAIEYGSLYNWFAVNDSRNIAPEGWHVASLSEWDTLINYLGGYSIAGGKLKEAGTDHWQFPNTGATNESGFTGLPGGLRAEHDGNFYNMGITAFFWTSTESQVVPLQAHNVLLYQNSAAMLTDMNEKEAGFSVRCIKD